MSANGATKRDLFRVIGERDAEILRLKELLREAQSTRPAMVTCPSCKGRGHGRDVTHDVWTSSVCRTCNGIGQVAA